MAGLLVSLGLMSILMSMVLPVWSQAAKREREAELIFRGEQYARAIELYQRRFVGAYPADFEALVEQRFLRRLYKDPMTEDGEFRPIYQSQVGEIEGAPDTASRPGETPEAEPGEDSPTADDGIFFFSDDQRVTGGVIGVVSRSEEESLRIYNGREKYNEWAFVYTTSAVGGGGAGGPVGSQSEPAGRPGGPPGRP